ncbi:MAG: glutamate synthase-related protein [Clostridiales bacterium]|jgi:glutamate synthase domain-containing protein 2|nr:glutamate synthase-related protein [Clostridiales bacterium]MCI2160807.1 glutamate synthase-related protein [Oscillospiraceae bacterium]MCI1961950.1 glutamate synthase-related protein [Clostridiales bacterium]MCI2022317.1 glutamate synthase-related protein [Clostridiales bacterium]MCI2026714.1 glutamate synthase-related protein [Clostridiales bacterium]
MNVNYELPAYEIVRNEARCIGCRLCEEQCANEVHSFDQEHHLMMSDEMKCVNCQRCVAVCPTRALKIVKNNAAFKENHNWSQRAMTEIYRQAESGGMLLSGMGTPNAYPNYWDKLLINASQVTNPSIDPLREPMETRTYLGKKASKIVRNKNGSICTETTPQLKLNMPILFGAMSYGAISYNAHEALAKAAQKLGTFYNTGEGGLHEDLYQYGANTIVQVASARFGVHPDYLKAGAAIEIKMGQGAKPGIGGHLTGSKIVEEVSRTRMIPMGTDAISPAPHHDIYSIEDLRQLVYSLKEATEYKKPIIVKIAAVHNVAAIASGIARSGADIIAIDGFRAGTGAAPTRIRDNVGIPIELALAAVDRRLREEGIRGNISLIVSGSIHSSADVVKAIALGADAVYIATAALLAMGCHLCRTCQIGKCNWGIATQRPDLVKRLNPDEASRRLVNLVNGWNHELMEMMGGMGINSVEALRGNRLMLRGIGLNEKELEILGVKHAGE